MDAKVKAKVDARANSQELEYNSYVANGPIYHDGALAYVAGSEVPVSNVKAHKYVEQGLVSEVGKAKTSDKD